MTRSYYFMGIMSTNTLVVIKQEHRQIVHDTLYNFDKNLIFIVDTFDFVPIFLTLKFTQMA